MRTTTAYTALLALLFCAQLDLSESVPRKLLCRENCEAKAAFKLGAQKNLYPPPLPSAPGMIYISELRNKDFVKAHPEIFRNPALLNFKAAHKKDGAHKHEAFANKHSYQGDRKDVTPFTPPEKKPGLISA